METSLKQPGISRWEGAGPDWLWLGPCRVLPPLVLCLDVLFSNSPWAW